MTRSHQESVSSEDSHDVNVNDNDRLSGKKVDLERLGSFEDEEEE
jgi:hypothetical protein